MKLLSESSVFWSKLGYCYDPPRIGADGNPVLFATDFERFENIQEAFARAGIRVFSSILFTGWVGVDAYDYRLTDRVLRSVFSKNPENHYIPRIKLNVPLDWCSAHPEDVFVYHEGPRDDAEIQRLVGTASHDILGYESSAGYGNTFGFQDDRPNIGGVIALQSFSSARWLADAGEALARIIRHIETGPYADRIPGYHIAYGAAGETCFWGRSSGKLGDWGLVNRRAFFDWGLARYGTLRALRQAWGAASLGHDESGRGIAEPPPPEARQGRSDSLRELMRARPGDRVCVDYDLFCTDVNVNAIEHFGRIVKAQTGGKAVGCFYGYVLECDNAASSGWLGYDRLLASPHIDFFAAPKSYRRNAPGEPGGVLGIAQSVNRKKLWMDEIDIATHLAPKSNCRGFLDTRSVLWREFAKNLSHGSNFWWMDLGGGWYDSPEIMAEIATMEHVATKLRALPRHSVAEILVVVDEWVPAHVRCGEKRDSPLHQALYIDLLRELHLCGMPVDVFRLADLRDMELGQYRLVVCLNAFFVTGPHWARIEPCLRPDATVLWMYAAGICAEDTNGMAGRNIEDGFSLENITKLTGFRVREVLPATDGNETPANPLPRLIVIPRAKQEILKTYPDGTVSVAARKPEGELAPRARKVIYSGEPVLDATFLRMLAERAGCHAYAPCGVVVYADNRFVAVFEGNTVHFDLRF